ncbi:Uu.00g034290.m01.CDS01 [Anthostomella pinea]|uniref:Uu.00g034290.m01.CDS01 n=1 Tax=Anthostomella pinea TaxID=933095 RepID=A0AAI8VA19_9PEZI|nr:Uu.00g034290.m01.CDS01 [Anthostomella pinea]
MSSKPKLKFKLLNPTHKEPVTFPQFSRLPKELRIAIWKLSLQRQRLVKVKLEEYTARRQERMSPSPRGPPPSKDHTYRVTRAQQAALEFYRVRVPAVMEGNGEKRSGGVFRFNPGYDILHIQLSSGWHQFVAFLAELKTWYDPRGVGLLNFALDHDGAAELKALQLAGTRNVTAREAFVCTVAGLKEVFYLCVVDLSPDNQGSMSGDPAMNRRRRLQCPIMPDAPAFERMGSDPRPIPNNLLRRVSVGEFDPRGMIFRWQKLRWTCGIPGPDTRQYRLLVSAERPGVSRIASRKGVAPWLRDEYTEWVESIFSKVTHVKQAVGFWLFPVEPLGRLPHPSMEFDMQRRGPGTPRGWKPKRVVDFTAHWPELGLASLP